MGIYLKVGKTCDAFAHLTTPLTPQTPFAPWGFSPQAKRLLSPLERQVVGVVVDRYGCRSYGLWRGLRLLICLRC